MPYELMLPTNIFPTGFDEYVTDDRLLHSILLSWHALLCYVVLCSKCEKSIVSTIKIVAKILSSPIWKSIHFGFSELWDLQFPSLHYSFYHRLLQYMSDTFIMSALKTHDIGVTEWSVTRNGRICRGAALLSICESRFIPSLGSNKIKSFCPPDLRKGQTSIGAGKRGKERNINPKNTQECGKNYA